MLSIGGSRAAAAAAAAAEKAKESSAVATGPGGHTHQQHPQQQQQQQAVLTREQLRDLKQIDTIHRCLHFVNSRGVPLHGVTAEDVVSGSLEDKLRLCHSHQLGRPIDKPEEVTSTMKPIQQFFSRADAGRDRHVGSSADGKNKDDARTGTSQKTSSKPRTGNPPPKESQKSKLSPAGFLLNKKNAMPMDNLEAHATLSPIEERLQTMKTKKTAQQHIYTDSRERAAKAIAASPITVQQQSQQQQQQQQLQQQQQASKESKAGWRSRSLPTRASGRPYPPSGEHLSFNWSPQLMGHGAPGPTSNSPTTGPEMPPKGSSVAGSTPKSSASTLQARERSYQQQQYPSSPNIPKHIKVSTAHQLGDKNHAKKKPNEPYYAELYPDPQDQLSPNRTQAVQITYPARRGTSISNGKINEMPSAKDMSKLHTLPAKVNGAFARGEYSVVHKKTPKEVKRQRKTMMDDDCDSASPPPPPPTRRVEEDTAMTITTAAVASAVVSTASADTPHEEGSSSVVIKAPEDNTAVFNPIQPPRDTSTNSENEDETTSGMGTSPRSAFEPINKNGRILRTTSLPAGPRPNIHTRHVQCPIADYHPSKEMVSTLLQKIATIESQQEKTMETIVAERDHLRSALQTETLLLRNVYARNDRRQKIQRRKMEDQIQALQSQIVSIARHTAYFVSRLEEQTSSGSGSGATILDMPAATILDMPAEEEDPADGVPNTFSTEEMVRHCMGGSSGLAMPTVNEDNLCSAVSLPSLCSQTPSPRPHTVNEQVQKATSEESLLYERQHETSMEPTQPETSEVDEEPPYEHNDCSNVETREDDACEHYDQQLGDSYDLSQELTDIRHVFSHLEKFNFGDNRRHSLSLSDMIGEEDTAGCDHHDQQYTDDEYLLQHVSDVRSPPEQPQRYNERNIDLAIRFSEQTQGPITPQHVDSDDFLSPQRHTASHAGAAIRDPSASSVSSETWTSPNRLVKVKKFFGQEPPQLLRNVLKSIQCEHLAKKFEKRNIGILELPLLTEKQLKDMKIPKTPRQRILNQARKMQAGLEQ
ncbi:uncharacterized protein LOC135805104 isoform X3 [Sycon ciliatum]|uniref:uncharacterized protein LOC135805104 isoform X3 n=1 Tax=Sycon ciliatum TaxID=27933 RepID=UPI0031F6F4FF